MGYDNSKLCNVASMARELMNQHGLGDWIFQWSRAKTVFGTCRCSRKTITLSEPLMMLNDLHEIRNTILHEIAHAIAGHKAGHGPAWMSVAVRVGARPERCAAAEAVTPEGRYKGKCNCPDVTHQFHKQPRGFHKCRRCRTRITWMVDGAAFTPAPKVRRIRRPRFATSLAWQLLNDKIGGHNGF